MPWIKHSLGVSLDEGRIELVYLRATWKGRHLVDCAAYPLPSTPEEEATFSQEVQKFLLKNGVRPVDRVTFGLPRREVLFRHLDTPPVQGGDLSELIAFESGRHLPGGKDEFVTGYRVLGRTDEGGYRLILAAVKKDNLARHLTLLKKANLTPDSIQPGTMGTVEAFRQLQPESSPALLLAPGRRSLAVEYVEGGQLVESWYFAMGGRAAGEDRAARESGRGDDTRLLAEAAAAKLSAPLFRRKLPEKTLPPVWVQGPLADDKLFLEVLHKGLSASMEVFRPLEKIGGGPNLPGQGTFAAAAGLALLGLSPGKRGLEVSEEGSEDLQEKKRYKTTGVLALVLAALLAAVFTLNTLHYRQRLGELDEEVSILRERKAAVEALSLAVQNKRDQLDFLAGTIGGRMKQSDLLKELTGLLPANTHLSDYTFRQDKLEISGLAPSASTLIPKLEGSRFFKEVAFSSAIVSQGKNRERFKIKLTLERGGDGQEG